MAIVKGTRKGIRQVAKKVAEGDGKISVSRAMREVGYSESTAKNPQRITKTRTWQKIMDEEFPDEKISKIHNKLLNAKGFTTRSFPKNMSDDDIKSIIKSAGATPLRIFEGKNDMGLKVKSCFFTYPKEVVIDKALDKVYKLKGRYTEKIEFAGKFRSLSNEDLMEFIKETSKSLKKK